MILASGWLYHRDGVKEPRTPRRKSTWQGADMAPLEGLGHKMSCCGCGQHLREAVVVGAGTREGRC